MSSTIQRRMSLGAEPHAGGVSFRVHAPEHGVVAVVVDGVDHAMRRGEDGLWEAFVEGARAGARYGFRLDRADRLLPDLASRWQPDGPHGLSAVVDPDGFRWTDADWRGPDLHGLVIQEIHLGTFTDEGTCAAAIEKLPLLREVGIDCIELMPVNDFAADFGWGYDGVLWFAPFRGYGTPDELKRLVDRAHALGIAVLMDVVYNHLGPEGQYFADFSSDYFSTRYENEWGDPLNFDDAGSDALRRLAVENAAYWVREYHVDGLRFDATQQIYDETRPHIVAAMAAAARRAAEGRRLFLVAENTPQDVATLAPADLGGRDLDGMWNEDFQRAARIAVTGQRDAYYSDLEGTAAELVGALRHGFLYQGQRSGWENQPRGSLTAGIAPERFVSFVENHDQIANSLRGDRLARMGDPAMLRAVTALLLLGPQTPLLFQGQEFGSTAPFTYFVGFTGDLAASVRQGRQAFLEQFPAIRQEPILDPCDLATFRGCVLDWSERARHPHWLALHRDLIALRRSDPVLRLQGRNGMSTAAPREPIGMLRLHGGPGDGDRLLVVNTGIDWKPRTVTDPIVATPDGKPWRTLWTSDALVYGGRGAVPVDGDDGWTFPGRSAVLLACGPA